MLLKDEFVKFIERSFLNKSVESLVLEIKDNKLSTYFKTDDLGPSSVEVEDFNEDDCEIGVYYPDVLLKFLSVLDNEITLKIEKNKQDEVTSLKFKDKKGKVATYATSSLELFDRPEKKTSKITNFEIKINLNTELIEDILKSTGVSSTDRINFIFEKDKLYAVFGYSTNNTNQIKFELECEDIADIGNIPFKSKILKEILAVNSKKFKTGVLQINAKGLLRLSFEEDKNKAEYFLMKLTEQADDSQ